ncbi:esterase family protein [Actinomadura sp. KC345]|uniref:alpha/beta hydrolase n=1 Tax=Actinomadura sp. KC345 TaxID=2530371 RepID=UPI001052FF42|nr:alpha/beta hydrolase family protein [Actinomadura sp. KC345]TDC48900.1 esterase family protein [Actinomadura sp. KC345]
MAIKVLDEEKPGDRLRRLVVQADSLGPEEWSIQVLLPHGWSEHGGGTWPLLTLHHGGLDDSASWTRHTDVEHLSRDDGVLVAMPDGGRFGGYADWRSGPRWQTFHVHDLHALMRERYRASAVRAVAGVSGGGYGALLSAAAHPGMFRFAASLSGPCTIRSPLAATTLLAATGIAGRVNPFRMWGVPVVGDRHWRAADPLYLAAGLRGTGVFVSCGLTGRPGALDPPGPWSAANLAEPVVRSTVRPFLRRLRALGIPATAHLYRNGTHSWPYWERELHRIWPRLIASVGARSRRSIR